MIKIAIGRTPVLRLWASVVAERLDFERSEALSLGYSLSRVGAIWPLGMAAGLHDPTVPGAREQRLAGRHGQVLHVNLLGMAVPAVITGLGVRGLVDGKRCDPGEVEEHLASEFGPALREATDALAHLAWSWPPAVLASRSWRLYEAFRPAARRAPGGNGQAPTLDLLRVTSLAKVSDSASRSISGVATGSGQGTVFKTGASAR